jgi:hypothetical protein
MEESLKFNSQVCTTLEQSQRLLGLGLKPETADMYIFDDEVYIGKPNIDDIPAWSLHRLLYCLMPNSIKDYYLAIYSGYVVTYDSLCGSRYEVCKDFNESLNIYDNIIDCIEWLIKEDYFNKEYLKQ